MRITQTKSRNGSDKRQLETLRSLGLRRSLASDGETIRCGARFQISNSRFQIPDSKLQIPDSKLQIPVVS